MCPRETLHGLAPGSSGFVSLVLSDCYTGLLLFLLLTQIPSCLKRASRQHCSFLPPIPRFPTFVCLIPLHPWSLCSGDNSFGNLLKSLLLSWISLLGTVIACHAFLCNTYLPFKVFLPWNLVFWGQRLYGFVRCSVIPRFLALVPNTE